MLLSDGALRSAVAAGHLGVDPFDPARLQPASIDVTLDARFLTFRNDGLAVIDPKVDDREHTTVRTVADGEAFTLLPNEFVLGATAEVLTVADHLAVRVEGKSSLARLGLLIHTAGFVDPGFHGQVTLEFRNLTPRPILLWPGMPIGQLCVFQLDAPAERPYSVTGKYQGQQGPTPSQYFQNFPDPR